MANVTPMADYPLGRIDRLIAVFLLVFVSSVYFAVVSGITSSNDGSHYALLRTLVVNRQFTLNQFDDYAEGNDIAVRDGRLYSDRPPGTALVGTLFYMVGGLMPEPLTPLPSRHDASNPRLLYVLLLPVLAGTGTVMLLYWLLRRQHLSPSAALTASLMFALGTIHWKYSTVLFSHALSSFLVILSLCLAVALTRPPVPQRGHMLLLGFVLGCAVLVEYSNVLLVLILSLYLLLRLRPLEPARLFGRVGLLALGGLPPAAVLAYYNYVNFGSPFTLSYAYAVNYPWAGTFGTTFTFPLGAGLRAMIIWGEGGGWCQGPCYNQGFLLLSPILFLAVAGIFLYHRRARDTSWLAGVIFLIYLLLFARHHTFHGFTGDGRYLVPFLWVLGIPLGFFLEWMLASQRSLPGRTLLYLITYGLFFLSLRNVFLHIGFSYNYALDLTGLEPLAADPRNWAYLVDLVFPNVGNLPLLWLLEGAGLLAWWSWHLLSRKSAVS